MGRALLAMAVAGLAFVLQHSFWWYNSLIWPLVMLSTLVPLVDRLLPAEFYQWPTQRKPA